MAAFVVFMSEQDCRLSNKPGPCRFFILPYLFRIP